MALIRDAAALKGKKTGMGKSNDRFHSHETSIASAREVKLMRVGDFVEVVAVDPVVQLSQVRDAPRTEHFSPELAPLIDNYLVVEGANAAAVHGLISSLSTGGAFLLSGVYGTGKSHLMAVLGLIAEFPEARLRFSERNPGWKPLLQTLPDQRFFTTYISLDEFDPSKFSLETIVAREIAAEAERKGFSVPTDTAARGEWLQSLWHAAEEKGFAGIVILLDELAMFLNAKSGEGLNRDASFLQFLAQSTRRVPFLLVGALQRGVEDLQRVDPYALMQVRDRFKQTWVLGLSHALPLINTVLLRKHNVGELRNRLTEMRRRNLWAQKFSVEHLFACYPFHPLTIRCLERSIGSFFSRNRSIVTFVQWAVSEQLGENWQQLITPHALIDHFELDMQAHPQLRPFVQQILPYFETKDRGTGEVLQVVKTLLSFQVGGEEPSAQTLADALMRDVNEVWMLLEQLRSEANFIDIVHRTGSPADTYKLDPQITVTDALRHRLNETVQSLTDDDPRLIRYAWECRSEEWAPPTPFEPRVLTVNWLRTQRKVAVTVTDLRRLTERQLHQTIATLSSPHTDECLHLFVAIPIAIEEQRQHFAKLLEKVILWDKIGELPHFSRFLRAVAALLPRKPNEAGMRRWKENTAVWLLTQDLSLAESELGMKVLERLREMTPARQKETQRLMQRLYGEGVLLLLRNEPCELKVNELIRSEFAEFDELVQVVAEQILLQVFPDFPPIAPRREASPQTYHALTRLILKGLPVASLDTNAQRWLELVAMPLGVVSLEKCEAGQKASMGVVTPPAHLTDTVLRIVGNGLAYRQVERELAKSGFGLTPELTQLVIAAMLRLGWLVPINRNGETLMPEAVSTPLARSVASLRPAQVLSDAEWQTVRGLITALIDDVPEKLTPEMQQRVWMKLQEMANAWRLAVQDLNARLAQWKRELNQSERQWRRTTESVRLCAELTNLLTQPLSAADGLRQMEKWAKERGLNAETLKRWLEEFGEAAEFFSQSTELLNAMRYLNSSGWLPGDLAEQRNHLLDELQSGEQLIKGRQSWLDAFRHFRDNYINAYIAHHEAVHGSEDFEHLQELKRSEAVQLLAALSSLPEAMGEGRAVIRQLENALAQQCSETPLTLKTHLLRSPLCPRCGLTMDKSLNVDAGNIAREVERALMKLKAWFCSDEQKEKLRRFLAAAESQERAVLDQALSLTLESDDSKWRLVPAALPLLQKALSPYTIIEANLDELCELLEGRYLTCDEAMEIFQKWLGEKLPSARTKVRFVRRDSQRP